MGFRLGFADASSFPTKRGDGHGAVFGPLTAFPGGKSVISIHMATGYIGAAPDYRTEGGKGAGRTLSTETLREGYGRMREKTALQAVDERMNKMRSAPV